MLLQCHKGVQMHAAKKMSSDHTVACKREDKESLMSQDHGLKNKTKHHEQNHKKKKKSSTNQNVSLIALKSGMCF